MRIFVTILLLSLAGSFGATPTIPPRVNSRSVEVAHTFAPEYYGASTNSLDNTAAIQAALDAAGNGGAIYFQTAGKFTNTSGLRFYPGQTIRGATPSTYTATVNGITNQTEIILTSAGGTNSVFCSYNASVSVNNVTISDMRITATASSVCAVNFKNVSFSTLRDLYITGADVGVIMDADVIQKSYFNNVQHCNISYNKTANIRLDHGANANYFNGCVIGGDCPKGVEILNATSANMFVGCFFQGVSGVQYCIYNDGGQNSALGCYFEIASIAGVFDTSNGRTIRYGSTFGAITTEFNDNASAAGLSFETGLGGAHTKAISRFGILRMTNDFTGTTITLDESMNPRIGSENITTRYGMGTNTSGTRTWEWYDGTSGGYIFRLDKVGQFTINQINAKLGLYDKLIKKTTAGLAFRDSTDASDVEITAAAVKGSGPGQFDSLTVTNAQTNLVLTAGRALVTDASKRVTNSVVTATELGFVSGVTSSIQTQLGARGYIITLSEAGLFAPADSATYFLGADLASPRVAYTNASVRVPRGGTIKNVYIKVTVGGTLGTTETVGNFIRVNDATDVTVGNMTYDAAVKDISTDVSQAVAVGDWISLKLVAPAWATNPTNVRWYCAVYIE